MKHKGQLVCNHLEKISRDALEKHQEIIKDFVKGKHGIYALFSKDRLYYVGLASDLRNRLKNHLHDQHSNTWDRFSVYLTVNSEHLRDLEALVIKIASPEGNKTRGNFSKSQNIMRQFEQDIKTKQHNERDHLFGRKKSLPIVPKKKAIAVKGSPALAAYVTQPFQIRLTYKGELYEAIVQKDGTILYNGKAFNSPSMAAVAIKGRASNGWVNWQYKNSSGEWFFIDELRRK
jgi:hypothetical protein